MMIIRRMINDSLNEDWIGGGFGLGLFIVELKGYGWGE